jgi:hypothetical protein
LPSVVRRLQFRPARPLSRNHIRSRNVLIQGGQHRAVGPRQLAQMAVSDLLRELNPSRKMRNIVSVGNKQKARVRASCKTQQEHTSLSDRRIDRAASRCSDAGNGSTIERLSGRTRTTFSGCSLPIMSQRRERTHGASRSSDTPRHKAEPGLAGGRAAQLDRQRAGRMVTLAGNLHILAACILACFSAILLACRNLALARKMGTLLRFSIFHKKLLGTPDMRLRLHSWVCGCQKSERILSRSLLGGTALCHSFVPANSRAF